VKPGNVLLGRDGRIKLGDFGIARLLVGQSAATTDQIAFTPEHVAPEVLRNEPDGPWSDVYGLASTLATALAGSPPLQQGPDERMQAFLARKVLAPPPTLDGRVPAVLAGPITRALDPQPSRRPSVGELRDQLAEAALVLGRSAALPPPAAPAPPVSHRAVSSRPPSEAVTSRAEPPGATRPAHEGRRPRRETFPVLVSILFAVLAATAAIIMFLTFTDDGGEATTTTGAPAAAPTTLAALPVPAPVTSTAPTTASSPVPTSSPATTVATTASMAASTVADPPPAPSTAAPTTPTAPTTERPGRGPDRPDGVVTAAQADAFLRDYYDAVEAGDYERAWSELTPEFQRGKARSYDYFVGFWDENDIAVGDVVLVEATADRAIVDAELRWNGSGTPSTSRFELRASPDGLRIAAQETLGD
jgi:hypothetical protein